MASTTDVVAPADYKQQALETDIPYGAEDEDVVVHRSTLGALFFWLKSWFIPGMGMFCESYFVFSIGNITPIFTAEYPDCYKTHKKCSTNLLADQTYYQVVGIIVGMLTLGYLGDRIGRKWGSVTTAGIMFIGGILLTASGGVTIRGWVICFTIAQTIFGYGVGGEYPMASSSASERAEASKAMRHRRGELVVCTFAMQGWGNFINTIVLIILLCIFGENHKATATNPYNQSDLGAVWRLSFGIGLIPVTLMLLYRIFRLPESKVWKKEKVKVGTGSPNLLLIKHYWSRLAGTALGWFFWDVSFYGNKLFQSTFIKIISPNASLVDTLLWTMLNAGIALVGYYFAAFTIDSKWMGRMRMQVMGFCWVFVLFLICAAAYTKLIKPDYIHVFQFLYFFSSFWDVRGTAHGISAATGKAGALLAAVLFNYINNQSKFYVCAFCNLAGLLLTILFIPNLGALDLREGDRRWNYLLQGRAAEYHGEAVNPSYLSLWERLRGAGKYYSVEADLADEKLGSKPAPVV
ncbi:hypothetical protein WJX72_004025 [[Myrmecia] bisecta]|uniref:Major facilitator superfamily (MFS) profile domain-containing protein n=1 Tax=[Myrmecia] bisecta TaxID=41462 RepID=A0AAW1PX73_9CHLO